MKLLIFLMVVGISCAQYAEKCKKPVPQNQFSIKKLSGSWFLAAYMAMNPQEEERYSKSRCGVGFIHYDQGYHKRDKFALDLLFGNVYDGFSGTYSVPNKTLGAMKLYYRAGNFTYDYTVTCTDYKTLAVVYVCAEVTPQYTSEFVLLFVRHLKFYNANQYSNLLAKRCTKDVTTKLVKDWVQMPFYDCPDVI